MGSLKDIMDFVEITEQDFAEFARTHSTSFLQSGEMAELLAKRGYGVNFVAVKFDRTEIRLAAVLSNLTEFGGKKFELNFGPIGEFDGPTFEFFLTELKKYVKAQGALELDLRPDLDYLTYDNEYQARGRANEASISQIEKLGFSYEGRPLGYAQQTAVAGWQYVKDLSNLTETTLAKSYAKDGLYSVKKAKSFGIKVRALGFEELDKFKELTAAAADLHDFHDKDLAYYQEFYRAFGDNADFLVAEINFATYIASLQAEIAKLEEKIARSSSAKKERQRKEFEAQIAAHQARIEQARELAADSQGDVILSGAIFIYNRFETLYFMSGTLDKYRKLYASYLIQDEIMRRSLRKGILRYNFYGIDGHLDGSDSILHFKQAFDGYIVEKIGEFRYCPQPAKQKAIQGLKKILKRV